nr:hypothetical protein [Calditrichia bacterium]
MQKIIPGIVLFLVIVTAQVFPQRQANSPIKVDSVLIYGNEKTEDRVILREIPFQFPAHLEMADFQLIKNRLTNLFLFNRVALGITRQGQKKLLLIQVTESWYIYPVPIFFVNERDWDKLSYGFQVSHFNFRGMNEKLSIGGWLGYNPSFFIHYNNPWVGKKLKLILGFNLFGKKVSNRFFDFDE